jgi:hypothetical protein
MNDQTQDVMIALARAAEWKIVLQHVDWRIAPPLVAMMAAGHRGLSPFNFSI